MRAPAGQRLIVRELSDAIAALPELALLDPQHLDDADILICVLGFEDRCLAVPQALVGAGVRARSVVVCRYLTNRSENAINDPDLAKCLGKIMPGTPHQLDADSGDFGSQLRNLVARYASDKEATRVYLDASVASNALIIRALAALLDLDIDLHVLYAEAENYRPTQDEYETSRADPEMAERGQLAHGVLDVTVASEFPGRHAVALPHRIIIFPGFDRDRVRAAISQVDNDFIMEPFQAPLVWMIGRPLHDADAWRQAALINLHGVPPHHERHTVSTFDYRETMYALEDVHQCFGLQSNLSVVPLGSKMQAVAVALFCLARKEVAVVVSQPREYHAVAYSAGARALWHLPLGRTADISRSLQMVDTVHLEPLE